MDSKVRKLPTTFFQVVESLGLIDIWRAKHPLDKNFTFYSHSNNSASRIESMWASKGSYSKVRKVEIMPRALSDHNPMIMEIWGGRRDMSEWRLKESMLGDMECLRKVEKTLKEYFEINLNDETDIKVVCDAGKAVIRGFFIQQNAYQRKIRGEKEETIGGNN